MSRTSMLFMVLDTTPEWCTWINDLLLFLFLAVSAGLAWPGERPRARWGHGPVLIGPRARGRRCLTESGTDRAGRQTDVLVRKFYHRSLDVIQGSSSSMQQLNQKHFLIMKWEVPFTCFLSYYRQLKVSKCFSEPV